MTAPDWRTGFIDACFQPAKAKQQQRWLGNLWQHARRLWCLGDVGLQPGFQQVEGHWVSARSRCRSLDNWTAKKNLWTPDIEGLAPGFAFKIPVDGEGSPKKWSIYFQQDPEREPLRLDFDGAYAAPASGVEMVPQHAERFVVGLIFHPPLHLHLDVVRPGCDDVLKARINTAITNPWLVCYQAVVQLATGFGDLPMTRPAMGVEPRHTEEYRAVLALAMDAERRGGKCEARGLLQRAGHGVGG